MLMYLSKQTCDCVCLQVYLQLYFISMLRSVHMCTCVLVHILANIQAISDKCTYTFKCTYDCTYKYVYVYSRVYLHIIECKWTYEYYCR